MEHRCGHRHAVNMTILLRRRGWGGWLVGELTDVSISGAFVRVPAGAFANHVLIELEASQQGSRRMLRSKALIVRTTPQGIGIVFDELRPEGLAPLFDTGQRPVGTRAGASLPFIPDGASSARA
jgi:hypothetical protein